MEGIRGEGQDMAELCLPRWGWLASFPSGLWVYEEPLPKEFSSLSHILRLFCRENSLLSVSFKCLDPHGASYGPPEHYLGKLGVNMKASKAEIWGVKVMGSTQCSIRHF